MFRIEFFCDDKKLAQALQALAGIAATQPTVVPVINVEKSKGELKQNTNGRIIEMFSAHLRKTKPATINSADVKAFLQRHGRPKSSVSYLLSQAPSGAPE
jgi:hypothetical protein